MARTVTEKTAAIKVVTRNSKVVLHCEATRASNVFQFSREQEIRQDGVVISSQPSRTIEVQLSVHKDAEVTLNDGTKLTLKQLNEALNKFGDTLEELVPEPAVPNPNPT